MFFPGQIRSGHELGFNIYRCEASTYIVYFRCDPSAARSVQSARGFDEGQGRISLMANSTQNASAVWMPVKLIKVS